MRRFLLASFLLAVPAVGLAEPFIDTIHHEFSAQIETLHEKGIVRGYANDIFHPDYPINRAEFLTILLRSLPLSTPLPTIADAHCFRDFTGQEQWFWKTACNARAMGIVQGYPDGTFGGAKAIASIEAIKTLIQAFNISLPTFIRAPDHWYDPYLYVANQRGVFTVIPHILTHQLTRGEMAALIVLLAPMLPGRTISSSGSLASSASASSSSRSSSVRCSAGTPYPDGSCPPLDANGFPLPLLRSQLFLQQVAGTGSDAVSGQSSALLFAFDATAGGQDVLLTSLTFQVASGSIPAGTNVRLTRSDHGTETPIADGIIRGPLVIVSSFKFRLVAGVMQRFHILADLPRGSFSGFSLAFASGETQAAQGAGAIDGRELTGVEFNGSCPGTSLCLIHVRTTNSSTAITPRAAGTLAVTQDSSEPSHEVLLGALSDPLLRLNFHATGEDIAVTQLILGGGTQSIVALELTDDRRKQLLATMTSIQCPAVVAGRFCLQSASGAFVVPKDADRHVVVRARVKRDTDGGKSGETVAITLQTDNGAVRARGLQSDRDLLKNDGSNPPVGLLLGRSNAGGDLAIVGSTNDLVGARIASIENVDSDPDNASVPIGTTPIGALRFRAAANANAQNGLNPVLLKSVTFTVTAVNVQIATGSYLLANRSDLTHTVSCSGDKRTGSITVACDHLDTSAISTTIEQGAFLDLQLSATVSAFDTTSPRTLQVSVNRLGSRDDTGSIVWDDGVFPFLWVDLGVSQVKSTLYRR
ncbi:S-layer homology domain-containing protein [Candidatus Peregrinibacteria bacterium]|nr:S-layer homology domain-containing protein [Candidatus Peregrinibacteria bacterium]